MPNIKFYDNAFDSADLKIKTCASSYRTARVTKLITPAKNILYKILSEDFITLTYINFSSKQLPRKMKTRLVIIECAGYIFWQLFLWEVYMNSHFTFFLFIHA